MIFKRSIQRYGRTPEPETPYSRAGQMWDERIGSARVQARSRQYEAALVDVQSMRQAVALTVDFLERLRPCLTPEREPARA